jgi:hypothetical protein
MEWEPEDFLDWGEGAYHSDEENRRGNREPYPDELLGEDFDDEPFDPDDTWSTFGLCNSHSDAELFRTTR